MKRFWLPPVSLLRAVFVLVVPAGIIVSGLLLPFRLPAAFLAPAAMLALLRRKLDSAPNRRTAGGIVIAATAGTVLSALALLLAAVGPFLGAFSVRLVYLAAAPGADWRCRIPVLSAMPDHALGGCGHRICSPCMGCPGSAYL